MINQNKWINSLPKENFNPNENQLDNYRWVSTISKKKKYNSVTKYFSLLTLFISGLLIVSAVKNETRDLQKEINNLEASLNVIEFNLNEAILDHEVITSPENISRLAKEHLNIDLASYKKSQIKNLNNNVDLENKLVEVKKNYKNKIKNLPKSIKYHVAKRIINKKNEIKKLQKVYSNPKTIPSEVKTQISKQIEEKKLELKNLYESPKDIITLHRMGKWGVVQVVKLFLGMPIIPGR